MVKNFKMLQICHHGFPEPKNNWNLLYSNNYYQISKNERNQNFKLLGPLWFLQKLALKKIDLIFG